VIASATAPACVALAGNPSDGYGGAVLALTIDSLRARVRVVVGASEADAVCCAPDLVAAAVARFARAHCPDAAGTRLDCTTSIPRHVELVELARDAGASANYAGSGGAVVCVCRDADVQADARTALVGAGCDVLPA
jgi:hypothetical protein